MGARGERTKNIAVWRGKAGNNFVTRRGAGSKKPLAEAQELNSKKQN